MSRRRRSVGPPWISLGDRGSAGARPRPSWARRAAAVVAPVAVALALAGCGTSGNDAEGARQGRTAARPAETAERGSAPAGTIPVETVPLDAGRDIPPIPTLAEAGIASCRPARTIEAPVGPPPYEYPVERQAVDGALTPGPLQPDELGRPDDHSERVTAPGDRQPVWLISRDGAPAAVVTLFGSAEDGWLVRSLTLCAPGPDPTARAPVPPERRE